MLEGLESVDWANVKHAYGPASDVPQLLRTLLSCNADDRRDACQDLHSTVWHQGTVYPASAVIIPFLFEVLACNNAIARNCAVSLLCCIATGEGWLDYEIRVNGEDKALERLKKKGRSLKDSLAYQGNVLATIRTSVSADLSKLAPYMKNAELQEDTEETYVASLLAEVFGLFPEHASWTLAVIDRALENTSNEHLRRQLVASRDRLTTR
jgi:hypothetical protein